LKIGESNAVNIKTVRKYQKAGVGKSMYRARIKGERLYRGHRTIQKGGTSFSVFLLRRIRTLAASTKLGEGKVARGVPETPKQLKVEGEKPSHHRVSKPNTGGEK